MAHPALEQARAAAEEAGILILSGLGCWNIWHHPPATGAWRLLESATTLDEAEDLALGLIEHTN